MMRASDVCLSRTSAQVENREPIYRKTKIGTEVAHVTRDSDTTFKVKRSTCRRPLAQLVEAAVPTVVANVVEWS